MPFENFTPKIDNVQALAMYCDGASDAVIARAFGVTPRGAAQWRERCRLPAGPSKSTCLPKEQIRRAKSLLKGGFTIMQVAAEVGISDFSVKRIRREMKTKGAFEGRGNVQAQRSLVQRDASLPSRIEKAIGLRVPRDIRMEAVNDMYLALLEGRITLDQIESAAPRFRSRAFSMTCFNYSGPSLDEDNDNGLSLAETLEDHAAIDAFDGILERVFAGNDN